MAGSMLASIDTPKLWAEACATAIYIKNQSPQSVIKGITPNEAL